MALTPFLYDDYYQLKKDGSSITLDLLFGSLGQSPDFNVIVDGTTKISAGKTSISDYSLGKDTDLIGKKLLISGNILDVAGTDDVLSIKFNVTGGTNDLNMPYSITAKTGEDVDISLTVRFY